MACFELDDWFAAKFCGLLWVFWFAGFGVCFVCVAGFVYRVALRDFGFCITDFG